MQISAAPITAASAEVAAALHEASGLSEHWDAKAFAELLAMPGAAGLFAVAGDPTGLILWRIAADEAEILTICVLPDRRRRGIGAFLLEQAFIAMRESGIQRILLEVAVDNIAARSLYETMGFEKQGIRRGYYHTASGSIDALIFCKI